MKTEEQIENYITTQPEPKQSDIRELHKLIQNTLPQSKLWFFDGKNGDDKTVANPIIGYGVHTITYANKTTQEWFQIGVSANKTGISVYILGIKDKQYLPQTYGSTLGKASVSGYCIKFKTLKDININVLQDAIKYAVSLSPNA